MKRTINSGLSAGALALALALGACGSSTTASPAATDASTPSYPLTITDGWCKAVDVPEPGDMHSASPSSSGDMDMSMPMTACFGLIKNGSSTDVTLSEAKVDTGIAGLTELHETVMSSDGAMKMQQKQGGFTIPAGQTIELKPGGNHIMLLDLKSSLKVGSTLAVTLTTSDGASTTVDLPVKAFTGAKESYVPSPSPSM